MEYEKDFQMNELLLYNRALSPRVLMVVNSIIKNDVGSAYDSLN